MTVAIDEHLGQLMEDLGQVLQAIGPLSLSLVLRNTVGEYSVQEMMDENMNHLFRICRKELGYSMLIISQKSTSIPGKNPMRKK